MSAKSRYLLLSLVAVAAAAGTWWARGCRRPDVTAAVAVAHPPRISPDYSALVVPPNIAPLNFVIGEPGRRFFVRIGSETGETLEITSDSPAITIPLRPWRRLLAAHRGQALQFAVYAEDDGQWQQYQPIINHVADEEIDPQLVYRFVGPIHNRWRQTAIRQRDVTGYADSTVLDGQSLEHGCVNCHSFSANDPERMLVAMRSGRLGRATLRADGATAVKIGKPFGYTAWHPSGRLAAYSVNKVRQFFHAAGSEVRDVIDVDGGLAYYRIAAQEAKPIPRASDETRLETYPAWSPDGRYLYYCSAPCLWTDRNTWPSPRYAEVKYDLMRIAYDLEADRWGEPETVLSAEKTGLSILLPRISPDGKFLLFCMCRYGCFPVLQPSSDLYLMRLPAGTYEKLDINSEFSESWHSWSSNSRWIAFSSRRQGGFFTRCYFSYVDETGRAHKPFVLPHEDPTYYESLLKSICVPELVTGPVRVSEAALIRAARSPASITLDSPSAEASKTETLEPYQPSGR